MLILAFVASVISVLGFIAGLLSIIIIKEKAAIGIFIAAIALIVGVPSIIYSNTHTYVCDVSGYTLKNGVEKIRDSKLNISYDPENSDYIIDYTEPKAGTVVSIGSEVFVYLKTVSVGRNESEDLDPSLTQSPSPSQTMSKHELNLFVIYFNPYLPKVGKNVSEMLNTDLDRRELMQQYCDSLYTATDGMVKYQVAEWVEINELPYLLDQPNAPNPDAPDRFPYNDYLDMFNIPQKVNEGEIDEVFILYEGWTDEYGQKTSGETNYGVSLESLMVGRDAYWCNAEPIIRDDCKSFVITSNSVDRGIDLWMQTYGFRVESILANVYNCNGEGASERDLGYGIDYSDLNLYKKFTNRWTTKSVYSNAQLGVGNCILPVNSDQSYVHDNDRVVDSNYRYFQNYPNSQYPITDSESVSSVTWKNAFPVPRGYNVEDEYQWSYLMWWFSLMPRGEGKTDGVLNDWWAYITDPSLVNENE